MVRWQQCFTKDIFNFRCLIFDVVCHGRHLKMKAHPLSFKWGSHLLKLSWAMAVTQKENRGLHGALPLGPEFSCGPPSMACTIIALLPHSLVLRQALDQPSLGPGCCSTRPTGPMPLWHLALGRSLGAQDIAVKTRVAEPSSMAVYTHLHLRPGAMAKAILLQMPW